MYSLNCDYYSKEFKTLNELISDVINSGMDPNYEVTYNGKGMNENQRKGFGILGIQERCASIDGTLTMSSTSLGIDYHISIPS